MATLMSALGGGLVGLYIAVDCLFSRSSVWAVLIKVEKSLPDLTAGEFNKG